MARRRKPQSKSGADSLLDTGIQIVASIAAELFDRWWNAPPKQTLPAHHQPAAKAKKSRPRKPPAWWRVLGVSQDASTEEIKRVYRDLISRSHPDKVAHLSPQLRKVAEREAKKLNAAYEEGLNQSGHTV